MSAVRFKLGFQGHLADPVCLSLSRVLPRQLNVSFKCSLYTRHPVKYSAWIIALSPRNSSNHIPNLQMRKNDSQSVYIPQGHTCGHQGRVKLYTQVVSLQ